MKGIFLFFSVLVVLLMTSTAGWTVEAEDPEGVEKQAFYLKTGQDLVDLCSLDKEHPLHEKGIAFCYGYVTGAMNFYGAIAEAPKVPKIICSESVIPRSLMVQVFLDWAKDNAEYLSEPPIDSLVRSAVAKWPCQKGNEESSPKE